MHSSIAAKTVAKRTHCLPDADGIACEGDRTRRESRCQAQQMRLLREVGRKAADAPTDQNQRQ